jgi:glycosyltransferase involved in cell wall biosynthesis
MKQRVSSPSRLMYVDTYFAPLPGGSEVLMANLLASYPGEVFAAVQQHNKLSEDPTFRPPCPVDRMWVPWEAVSCTLFSPYRHKRVSMWAYRRFLRREVHRRRPTVMMAAVTSWSVFVAAYQVAKQAGLPFYAHMHDLWQENWAPGSDVYALADRWEKAILTQSRRVLCMTDVQAEFYREKYGLECQLLPHTVPPATLAAAPEAMVAPSLPKPTVLVVTGLNYVMNEDAMRAFAKASELLPQDVEVLILSRTNRDVWVAANATSPRITIRSASREEVASLVSACHVLVAPLSHKNCSREEVRTVLSTKLLDYFVSGRPILVFAPADSFHARSAREGRWGLVVDQDDPRAIADGIVKLLGDEKLCAELVAGALAEARRRDAGIYARRLYDWTLADSGCSAKSPADPMPR